MSGKFQQDTVEDNHTYTNNVFLMNRVLQETHENMLSKLTYILTIHIYIYMIYKYKIVYVNMCVYV